jgi:plasmid maintenance system antidote protein VapI
MIPFFKIIQTKERNNLLLDAVMEAMHLKNDAALARLLEVGPPVVSKMRSFKLRILDSMVIRIHEETGFSIGKIKSLMSANGGPV